MSFLPPDLNFLRRRRLPLVLQTEAAECALACLVMISGYWGYQLDIATLRRRFSVSLKGTTLKDLIDLAASLGLTTRALKLELTQVAELEQPCILHWDMSHFVVLKKLTSQGVVIHDPAVGVRQLSLKALSDHFTGIALELAPGQALPNSARSSASVCSP